jgi:DNA-binding PadR family transcriptional regulator
MDVKTLCLGVLSRGDASGYEIKKAFEEGPFSHIHVATFGSIYPALSSLSEEGKLRCREEPQDKRPDKKVYSITEVGREALSAALMAMPAPDKVRSDFLFILFFAPLLPSDRLAQLIDKRIDWYRESLARMEDCGSCQTGDPGTRFVHGLGETVYRAAADYLTENRDRLLEEVSGAARLVAE